MKRLLALVLALVMALVMMNAVSAEPAKTFETNYEGKTVILHTNDVHGAIDGYAYIPALRAWFEDKGADVIVVDAGDFSQGTTYVSSSKGAAAVDGAGTTDVEVSGTSRLTVGQRDVEVRNRTDQHLGQVGSRTAFKGLALEGLDGSGQVDLLLGTVTDHDSLSKREGVFVKDDCHTVLSCRNTDFP